MTPGMMTSSEMQDTKLDKPYGVAMYDGKIYVCDTNATVIVLDSRGVIRYLDVRGKELDQAVDTLLEEQDAVSKRDTTR